jgi:site-specific recombinase XerD
VFWPHRTTKATQSTTWSDETTARRAAAIAKAHGHNITKQQVEDFILWPDGRPDDESTAPTLDEAFDQWHPSRTRPSPFTKATYARQYNSRIRPVLGHQHVDRITDTDIGDWVHHLRQAGLATKTITRYYSVVYSLLDWCEAREYLDRNPCKLLDFERDAMAPEDIGDTGHKAVYLSKKQYLNLRAHTPEHDRLLLDVLVGTGVRWSEATAIPTDLVHPQPGSGRGPYIEVVRAWKRDEDMRWRLGTTKGRRRREVDIPAMQLGKASLLNAVNGLVDRNGKVKHRVLKLDGKPVTVTFLLLTAAKAPYDYDTFYRRTWAPAVRAASRCPEHPPADRGGPVPDGVERSRLCRDHGGVSDRGVPCGARLVRGMTRCASHLGPADDAVSTCGCPGIVTRWPTPHDLRHSFAAWFLAGGGTMRQLQLLLGHASIATTEIYAGTVPEETARRSPLEAAWDDGTA